MADMRTIGTATEAYAVDWAFYPHTGGDVDIADAGAGLVQHLSPTYIKKTPNADGWREPFLCRSESRFYTVASAGRDKVFENALDDTGYNRNPTSDMDCDIVYANGTFVSYPEGVQTD